MKKLTLALALIFSSIAAMAIEQPLHTEGQALTKLYDAELTEVKIKPDCVQYKFDAISVYDLDKIKPLHGKICGDKITFE